MTVIERIEHKVKLLMNEIDRLEEAKGYVHYEYYKNDSINYSIEEDLTSKLNLLISDRRSQLRILDTILLELNEQPTPIKDVLSEFSEHTLQRLPDGIRQTFIDKLSVDG